MSKRIEWYNSVLDLDVVDYDDGDLEVPEANRANLISSLCEDGLHRPALDIDIPCRMVPSSTEGHCHLYFDTVALTWVQYRKLLNALAEAGIIQPEYVQHSIDRGQTLLRVPGQRKAQSYLLEWT